MLVVAIIEVLWYAQCGENTTTSQRNRATVAIGLVPGTVVFLSHSFGLASETYRTGNLQTSISVLYCFHVERYAQRTAAGSVTLQTYHLGNFSEE